MRTARARRAATSLRLCAAAFELIDERGTAGLTVDALIGRTALSRGAFYRYFASVEGLLDHLATAVGTQLNAEMNARFEQVADPALRIALFFRYQVTRVLDDRACATVLARHVALHGAVSRFADEHAMDDFAQAEQTGRFRIPPVRITVDLAHGMLASVLRRAVRDGADAARLEVETAFLLTACGVESHEATRLAAHALPELPAGDLRAEVLRRCTTG